MFNNLRIAYKCGLQILYIIKQVYFKENGIVLIKIICLKKIMQIKIEKNYISVF